MMKKLLYTIGFLMFSSALFSPVVSITAFGADPEPAKDIEAPYKCEFPWLRCAQGPLDIPDTDWGVTFGTRISADVGQDLYKNVLKMTRISPDKKAFKSTAGAFGATTSETVRLLQGDYSPIVDKNPYLTQDEAVKKMAQVQRRYLEEKDIFDLQANIEAAVTPNEIFVNGDVEDSGFDLINDLNNIENILFKKMDPIDIGGNFNESSSGGVGTVGGGISGSKTGPITLPGVPTATGAGPGDAGNLSTLAPAAVPVQTAVVKIETTFNTSGLGPKPSAAENPSICFADTKLDSALQNFDTKKAGDANLKVTATTQKIDGLQVGSTNSGANAAGSEASNGSAGSADSSANSQNPGAQTPPSAAPLAAVKPTPADNWLKNPPCNDIMCVQINFVKKTATAYVDSDNCIACHVEKINEKLKTTINHSLVPSKATGNLLEPGVCKQATSTLFGKANMYFYAIKKPVLTPINDDLIYGTNALEEWDKFVNIAKPFPFYQKKVPDPNDPNQDPFILNIEDRAVKTAAAYTTSDTTLGQLNATVQQERDGTKNKLAQAVLVAEPAIQNDADTGFYQSIRRELEQMNYYFTAYQNILHTITQKEKPSDTDTACENISKIKECK